MSGVVLASWLTAKVLLWPTMALLLLHNCHSESMSRTHCIYVYSLQHYMLILRVPLQIDFGKCKIALVAFVLLPNYCLPHIVTIATPLAIIEALVLQNGLTWTLSWQFQTWGLAILIYVFAFEFYYTLIASAQDPCDNYNSQRLLWIVHWQLKGKFMRRAKGNWQDLLQICWGYFFSLGGY